MPRLDFRSPRLFVDAPLKAGTGIALDRDQSNYLGNVLRLNAGDTVLVFNGCDGEWQATLAGRKRPDRAEIVSQTRPQDSLPDLHYVFAPLKHARLDYMAQKAVEMGASALRPVTTRHTQASRLNVERMRANVIEAAHELGRCRRFVDFSTSEVFGRYAYQVTEFDATSLGAVGEARWTYAVAKLATEHLALCYHRQYGFPSVTIRPFNIYGPRQVGEGAVHHFIVRALRNEPLQVHNDGAQIRSWCYIDDIIDATEHMLTAPEAVGHAFNIGNPRSTVTVYNLAQTIKRLAGSSSEIRCIRWDHPDVELRVPAVKKASELLGWSPRIDLEDGLLRTIDWYRNAAA